MGADRRDAQSTVHVYFDINLDIVWKTVHEDLPELIVLLETAISPDPASSSEAKP